MLVVLPLLFFSSFTLLYFFRQYAFKKDFVDNPNNRSLHTMPTPRGGGIVFMSLWFLFACIFLFLRQGEWVQNIAILGAVLMIAIVSFVDDKRNVSSLWRFVVHLLASLYFLMLIEGLPFVDFGFFSITSTAILSLLALFFIIWSINLFNFMDGSDGLAASEAFFIFLIGGSILGVHYQAIELASLCFALCAVIAGFLIWNWPRAKIFMGDVGSTCLGFLIAAIAILAQKLYGMSLLIWFMLYGFFLFDATITLLRRILKGEQWREAHRSHAYQRLVLSGWSHLQVLMAALLCNLIILILVVMALVWSKASLFFMLIEYIMLALLYYSSEKIYPMFSKI